MRSRSGNWSLDIENACLQADPFHREVYLHAPPEWCPKNPNRVRELKLPAYGLNNAPVAFHRSLERYLLKNEAFLNLVGLKWKVSNLGPCLYAACNREDEAACVFSSHNDDILGRGVLGVLERTRHFLEQRFGAPKTQENVFAHVGMELTQKADFSYELTQFEFTD